MVVVVVEREGMDVGELMVTVMMACYLNTTPSPHNTAHLHPTTPVIPQPTSSSAQHSHPCNHSVVSPTHEASRLNPIFSVNFSRWLVEGGAGRVLAAIQTRLYSLYLARPVVAWIKMFLLKRPVLFAVDAAIF